MQKNQIANIIAAHTVAGTLHRTEIILNEHNHQLDRLTLIFKPDALLDLRLIGNIAEDIDELVIADQYGDMTSLDINYTTYHEEDGDDDQYIAITFTPNIDS